MTSQHAGDIATLIRSLLTTLEALEQAQVELAEALATQLVAMKRFDTQAIALASRRQEQVQRRVLRLDQERRRRTTATTRRLGISENSSLADIAAQVPEQQALILKKRDSLRETAEIVVRANSAAARTAKGVLGHLNLALRLLSRTDTYAPTGTIIPAHPKRLEALA